MMQYSTNAKSIVEPESSTQQEYPSGIKGKVRHSQIGENERIYHQKTSAKNDKREFFRQKGNSKKRKLGTLERKGGKGRERKRKGASMVWVNKIGFPFEFS